MTRQTKKIKDLKNDVRRMILISNSCYIIFNKFWLLRAPNIVGQNQAETNVKIYNDFGNIFMSFEEGCLVTFAVIFRQLFDTREDSSSFYKLDELFGSKQKKEINLIKNNSDVKKIIKLRHKFFAHKDYSGNYVQRIIPSHESIKEIYNNILDLYGKITGINILLHNPAPDELQSLFRLVQDSNPRRFSIKL